MKGANNYWSDEMILNFCLFQLLPPYLLWVHMCIVKSMPNAKTNNKKLFTNMIFFCSESVYNLSRPRSSLLSS